MTGRRQWVAHCSRAALAALIGRVEAQAATAPRLLVVGDSLSAEYGIGRGQGWVALLEARLKPRGAAVINASISGDTTAGGLARLPALLRERQPSHVLIELGGNDALRGMPLDHTRNNLRQMLRAVRAAKAKALLIGMQVPPNYGARYGREFAQLFADLAREERSALVPFLLAGVADRPDAEAWFQADRIHPVARAHPVMLDNVWPVLKTLL